MSSITASASVGTTAPTDLLGLGAGLVKICGLRQPEHAVAAVAAGADLLGFIFAPARRRVTAEQAAAVIVAARIAAGNRRVLTVGVFVEAGAATINEVVQAAGLDLVQLNGDEPPGLLPNVGRPIIKAVRPPLGTPASQIAPRFEEYAAVPNAPVLYLVDGYVPGMAGGTGVRADWTIAQELAATWPVSLAGGLDPSSVAGAIRAVRPVAVDVSSGVETDGTKDPAKIASFVSAARRAFDDPNRTAV